MAITSGWYTKPTIYYIHCWGEVTFDDVQDAVEATNQAKKDIGDGHTFFHTITNLEDSTKLPLNIKDLINASKNLKGNSVNGWAIVVGNMNPAVQFVLSALSQMFRFRVRAFATLEEGLRFLYDVDPVLQRDASTDERFKQWLDELRAQIKQERIPA